MPGRFVSTAPTRSPRRASASVVRPPMRARGDLERPVGARAGPPVGDDLAAGAARHLHRARRRRAGDQQAVLGDERHELAERGAHRLLVAEDVGVIELDRRRAARSAGGSAGTSIPCRRRPCRTRRLRRRTRRRRRGARTAGSSAARRRSGTTGRARRRAARAPAATRSSSCRACPRRPRDARSAARPGTACRTATGTTRAGSSRSCAASTSTWSLRQTLPTTTASGAQSRFAGPKPSKHRNLLLRQLRRHGRVDVLVGAPHVVPGRLEQTRQRAHPRPADPDQMNSSLAARTPSRRGGTAVANRFTSIVKSTVKSRNSPSSRSPVPPEVSQRRCEITVEPQGSMRPRLRVLASALQASAASRLHRSPGPLAAHRRGCRTTRAPSARTRRYRARGASRPPWRPLGAVKVTSLRRPRQARRCRSRSRPAPAAKCPSVGESSVAPPPTRAEADLEPLVVGVGRRRLGDVAVLLRQVQGAPGRPCSARRPGWRRARPAPRSRARRRRRRPRRPPDAADPAHPSARSASASNAARRRGSRVRPDRTTTACDGAAAVDADASLTYHRFFMSPRFPTRLSTLDLAALARRSPSSRVVALGCAESDDDIEARSPTLSPPSRITRKVWPS